MGSSRIGCWKPWIGSEEIVPGMKPVLSRLLLLSVGLIAGLALAEAGARIYDEGRGTPSRDRTGVHRIRSCESCRTVFELNPEHQEVSSRGLRVPSM